MIGAPPAYPVVEGSDVGPRPGVDPRGAVGPDASADERPQNASAPPEPALTPPDAPLRDAPASPNAAAEAYVVSASLENETVGPAFFAGAADADAAAADPVAARFEDMNANGSSPANLVSNSFIFNRVPEYIS